jgi:hypothetical protein
MFYEIKKGGETVERFNAPVSGKARTQPERESETVAAALKRAKELGADEIVSSLGRKVL